MNALVAGNGSYIVQPCGHDLHGLIRTTVLDNESHLFLIIAWYTLYPHSEDYVPDGSGAYSSDPFECLSCSVKSQLLQRPDHKTLGFSISWGDGVDL